MAAIIDKLDCDITIIGRRSGDCCLKDDLKFKTKRFSMFFKRGFMFYMFMNIRLFIHLLFNKYDLLIANDLDTLLPNYLVSRLKGAKLVYDSHEYFTGVPEIQNRPFVRWVWKTIEKNIFPNLKYIITVSRSIADKYKEQYGVEPVVVRNCSPYAKNISGYSRSELQVPEGNLFIILQGTGINMDRGGEELIETMCTTDLVSLFIVGSGDIVHLLKEKAEKMGISDRVRFISKLPWEKMIRYTRSADAGMSLDKPTNLNYSYSLPNKLFDYLAAGIPVIAGDLPEIRSIVKEYGCGLIIPEVTSGHIGAAFKKLINDPDLLEKLKINASYASEILNWENESLIVIELYNRVINEARIGE